MVRAMGDGDLEWAAGLLAAKRAEYEAYSPVFWRPAAGITELHAGFLGATIARAEVIALRTDDGVVIAAPADGRTYVDDFAVTAPDRWATDGRELLVAVAAAAASTDQPELRVVTGRRDEPKRALLADLGLRVGARWWVKELQPQGEASAWGAVDLDGVGALIMPAPPVYDPGGPVCLLGDVPAEQAVAAADLAAGVGAVLAIVRRDGGAVPADEPELEAAGFHNPSEFHDGTV